MLERRIRRFFIALIKVFIFILPKALIDRVRKHPRLVMAYNRNLHLCGLVGAELQEEGAAAQAYKKYYIDQSVRIRKLIQADGIEARGSMSVLVCVLDNDFSALEATLCRIERQEEPFSTLFFWCREEDLAELNVWLSKRLVLSYFITTDLTQWRGIQQSLQPGFVVYAGDLIHPSFSVVWPKLLEVTAELAYSDTDTFTVDGELVNPDFKPDWNPDLQLTNGYVRSGVWLKKMGSFFEQSLPLTKYSVSLFMCARYFDGLDSGIQHIPLTLLTRSDASFEFNRAKADFEKLFQKYVEVYSDQAASKAVTKALPSLSLRWPLPKGGGPLVSIIIPTRNSMNLVKTCIDSILQKTTYTNYEILLVDNASDDQECIEYFSKLNSHQKIRVLNYPYEFNYSAVNNFAAKQAKGKVLALVNNDIEVISPDWLLDMVGQVWRQDIGCVGAKLLYPNDRVQHAGVVMGYGGGAGHAHKHFPAEHFGYMNRMVSSHNYSAVTAACLLVKADDFWAVGGLNEESLAIAFNDVDLCLKVLGLGRRNLYCAEAVLYHHESVSRGYEDTPEKLARFQKEVRYLQSTWSEVIARDPAYNPNLTLKKENFEINLV